MTYQYRTQGVCARAVQFDLTDGKVTNISFTGGCDGNLKAVGKLADGMEAARLVALLRGNTCGYKSTSCADQLACAVQAALDRGE